MRRLVATVALSLFSAVAFAQTKFIFQTYNNGAYPDLAVDSNRLRSSLGIVTQTFSSSSCELVEGSIGAAGTRRLLRFDVALVNMATADLHVGSPTDVNNPYHSVFEYSPCHGHYHITGFTDYELLTPDRQNVAAFGHKQAFCLEDILRYGTTASHGYTCGNQGITTGWADLYSRYLSGQWVDITGVPDGDYILHVEINAAGTFPENENRYPNVLEVPIHIPMTTFSKGS
jgi:Lysyl oxidase